MMVNFHNVLAINPIRKYLQHNIYFVKYKLNIGFFLHFKLPL